MTTLISITALRLDVNQSKAVFVIPENPAHIRQGIKTGFMNSSNHLYTAYSGGAINPLQRFLSVDSGNRIMVSHASDQKQISHASGPAPA
jgi:hypothetical protein